MYPQFPPVSAEGDEANPLRKQIKRQNNPSLAQPKPLALSFHPAALLSVFCSKISGLTFISPSPPWHYSVERVLTLKPVISFTPHHSPHSADAESEIQRGLVTRPSHPAANRNSNLIPMLLINSRVLLSSSSSNQKIRKSEAYHDWMAKIWTPGSLWASHLNVRSPRRQWRHRRPTHSCPPHPLPPTPRGYLGPGSLSPTQSWFPWICSCQSEEAWFQHSSLDWHIPSTA